ncbi:MAG: flippase [Candidatus Magasanikbacteria bacterium]|nr:flippase [Candidatus Magasanikbacteria bacterium]
MSYTVAQNTSFLTIASVLQKVISFFYFIFVARIVGVENTGVYFFAISFTTIFTVVADFGLGPVLTREASRFPDRTESYFNTAFWTKIMFGLMAYLLIVLFANLLRYPESTKILIYISGITMFFDTLATAFNSIFRAKKNLIYESIGVIASQFTTLIIGTVALLNKWPLVWLILAYTIPSFLNLLYVSGFLKKVYGIRVRFAWNSQVFKIFIITALPFALAGIIGRLYSYSDSLLMSKMLTAKELGWWSVPYKITFAFQFIPVALSASVYPVFSSLFLGDKTGMGPLFEKSWRYLFAVVFPVSLGLIAVADPVIHKVFGQEYGPSVAALRILLISMIFGFLSFITGALLNAINRQKIQTSLMGLALAVSILLNIVLIPKLGINGAAISAMVSNFVLCLVGFYFCVTWVNINIKNILKYLYQTLWPAAVMAVIVYILSFKIHYLVTIIIGGMIYLGLLYSTKVIDKELILNVINKIKPKSSAM